jgi:hypothetical protein
VKKVAGHGRGNATREIKVFLLLFLQKKKILIFLEEIVERRSRGAGPSLSRKRARDVFAGVILLLLCWLEDA